MRDIKFRAWDGVFMSKEPKTLNDIYESVGQRDISRCKDWVWMQWTGLKDKNGVDIYEGDIVKHYKEDWNTGFMGNWVEDVVKFEDCSFNLGKFGKYEIIGHIYEEES